MARKSALSVISPSTGMAQSGLSRTTVVYERLRQDLLHGDLKDMNASAWQMWGIANR